jgi:hypothetical protein
MDSSHGEYPWQRLSRAWYLPRSIRVQIVRQAHKGLAKYRQHLTPLQSAARRARGIDDAKEELADLLAYLASSGECFLFLAAVPLAWAMAAVRYWSPLPPRSR